MGKRKKQVLRLKPNHKWKAKPGYKIFVADRGAVRLHIPQDWILVPGSDSIKFHDREPPEDNCVLAVSFLRLPAIDWRGLPLSHLVQTIVEGDDRDIIGRGNIIDVRRDDLELAWTEVRFIDPSECRAAISRICLGRAAQIQSLITFDFWADEASQFSAVWDEVLHSLALGKYINDPTMGDVIH